MKIPIEVVAKSINTVPNKNKGIEPAIGTANTPCTINCSAKITATSTTTPIDHTLASIISVALIGNTIKCSSVPCSRSLISAAPANIIESMEI